MESAPLVHQEIGLAKAQQPGTLHVNNEPETAQWGAGRHVMYIQHEGQQEAVLQIQKGHRSDAMRRSQGKLWLHGGYLHYYKTMLP